LACAAVLCAFGATANASIPVKMAPPAQASSVQSVVSRWYIIIYVYYFADYPTATQELANVDQAAEFDRTT
jgi:hypothetical protein